MKANAGIPESGPLMAGEIGILQNMNRTALNGLIAEVTGGLRRRLLYSLTNPADSEICLAYKVRIPGYPVTHNRIEWCVKAFQLRHINRPGDVLWQDREQELTA